MVLQYCPYDIFYAGAVLCCYSPSTFLKYGYSQHYSDSRNSNKNTGFCTGRKLNKVSNRKFSKNNNDTRQSCNEYWPAALACMASKKGVFSSRVIAKAPTKANQSGCHSGELWLNAMVCRGRGTVCKCAVGVRSDISFP